MIKFEFGEPSFIGIDEDILYHLCDMTFYDRCFS